MLRIYKSPEGAAFWYEEGEQPEGYVLDEPKRKASKPANKAKAPANKSRRAKVKDNA